MTQSESLVVKRPDGTEFKLDMDQLRRLEARQHGAGGAGRIESLVLMGAMKDGYKEAGELRAKAGLELERARTALQLRKSIVYLDIVPGVLKEKGLASARSPGGSEDQRNAVLNMDEIYRQMVDYVSQLEAIRELLYVKMETFRMTYSTVKRNVDDSLAGMLPKGYSGGAADPQPARAFIDTSGAEINLTPARRQELQPAAEDFGGLLIGKARY